MNKTAVMHLNCNLACNSKPSQKAWWRISGPIPPAILHSNIELVLPTHDIVFVVINSSLVSKLSQIQISLARLPFVFLQQQLFFVFFLIFKQSSLYLISHLIRMEVRIHRLSLVMTACMKSYHNNLFACVSICMKSLSLMFISICPIPMKLIVVFNVKRNPSFDIETKLATLLIFKNLIPESLSGSRDLCSLQFSTSNLTIVKLSSHTRLYYISVYCLTGQITKDLLLIFSPWGNVRRFPS